MLSLPNVSSSLQSEVNIHPPMRYTVKSVLPGLFCILLFFGCAATAEPDFDGGAVTNTKPAIGSTYTFHQSVTEHDGAAKSQDTVKYVVGISPVDIKGKSGAYVFANSQSPKDTRTIAYETNGNISILVPLVTQSVQDVQWMTIPLTGSGGSKDLLLSEADVEIKGVPTHVKLVANTALVSTENITVGSKTYTAKKVKVTNTITTTAGIVPISTNDDDFYWWIPDLGFYGKSEEGGIDDPLGVYGTDITTETLTTVTTP